MKEVYINMKKKKLQKPKKANNNLNKVTFTVGAGNKEGCQAAAGCYHCPC
jgi:hypothetical protein